MVITFFIGNAVHHDVPRSLGQMHEKEKYGGNAIITTSDGPTAGQCSILEYICHGGYVITCVGLFVCLSVNGIMKKVLKRFLQKLVGV